MTTAFNLATGAEIFFDDATTPEYAVAYAHHTTNNRASWFFNAVHENDVTSWAKGIEEGKRSVCLGDWAALKR